MKWPFVLRSVHNVTVQALERERDEANTRASYWQARAELFIDRGLARAGVTHEPIMRHATPVGDVPLAHPLDANPFGGIGIHTIDSTKADGRVSN